MNIANRVPKLMLLLEKPSTIVGLYIRLWTRNEQMVILCGYCDDSNYILIYIVSSSNSICFRFYFYINSIARLSRPLVFPILIFWENTHRERIGGSNGRAGRRLRGMGPRVAAHRDQDLRARSHGGPSHGVQM